MTKVAKISKLIPGQCKSFLVNGTNVAVYNVDGAIYATADTCPHRGGALGEGLLEGRLITCPRHGWQFDVTTGAMADNPMASVQTYPVLVEDDDIAIQI